MTVKTLCLNMLVKNEMESLKRCLEAVAPYIACWVIGDTGSTDGTQEFIRSFFASRNIPGELHNFPFVDFAQARQEALDRARASELKYDYLLLMEADIELTVQNPGSLQDLTSAAYKVLQRSGVTYLNNRMLRRSRLDHWQQDIFISLLNVARLKEAFKYSNDEIVAAYMEANAACPTHAEALHGAARFCRYKGMHERGYEFAAQGLAIAYPHHALFVEDWIYEYGLLDEFAINAYWTARYAESASACDQLLSEGKLPMEERDRVLKNKNFAVNKLQKIAASSSPEPNAFLKLLGAAREKEKLGRPNEEVITTYVDATAACPTRAEALHGAARFCRNKSLHERGYEFAAQGLAIPYPHSAPAVEDWIYEYGLLDELAVNAYWTGKYAECADACDRLLNDGKLPTDDRDRVLKNKQFAIDKLAETNAPRSITLRPTWVPETPAAGTELMVAGLRERIGQELERINLQVNHPGHDKTDKRPRVVWMHHHVNQRWVQWCKDRELVDSVTCFVFVSYWQREQYLNAFGLPPQRCVVLRHALDLSPDLRRWEAGSKWRCAYTSTPFRGLSVLLDAWERLSPANAELHIWSSMKLYLEDDGPYRHLYERAVSMPGVIYHGIAPNRELRAALQSMHFHVYPCTFEETACLAVIEAMAAGCRVIVPSLGALPETTGGYARIYPSNPNAEDHARVFSENLMAEMATPWGGEPELSLNEQAHCAVVYDWPRRLREWRQLIQLTCDQTNSSEAENVHPDALRPAIGGMSIEPR